MTIVVRAAFYENNKYYPQVFLNECLYNIYMQKLSQTTKLTKTKSFYILLGLLLITIALLRAASIYCYLISMIIWLISLLMKSLIKNNYQVNVF